VSQHPQIFETNRMPNLEAAKKNLLDNLLASSPSLKLLLHSSSRLLFFCSLASHPQPFFTYQVAPLLATDTSFPPLGPLAFALFLF